MRTGIDFVPLNVSDDESLELIEAQFGLDAFAVVIKLWQRIYGVHGYYCEWDNDVIMLFAKKCGMDTEKVRDIALKAADRGLFSMDKLKNNRILTSHGIQKRYMKATCRKTTVEMKEEYLLLGDDELNDNVTILGKTVTETEETAAKTPLNKININKGKLNKNNQNKNKDKENALVVVVPENIISSYENNIGSLTEAVKSEIVSALKNYGEEDIIYAIEEAARQNHQSWKYVQGILRNRHNAASDRHSPQYYEEVEKLIMSMY